MAERPTAVDESELTFSGDRHYAEMAGSVLRHGVCRITALYPVALIDSVAAAAAAIYAHRDVLAESGALPPALDVTHRIDRSILLSEVLIQGIPAAELLAFDLLRTIAGVCLHKPMPSVHHDSYVRCVRPATGEGELPYHQDSRVLECPLVNIWIPFVDCGRNRPTLEVLPQRLFDLVPTISGEDGHLAQIGAEITAAAFQERFGADSGWHPEMAKGDVLVFTGLTVHRSYVTSAMDHERTSIDLRLI